MSGPKTDESCAKEPSGSTRMKGCHCPICNTAAVAQQHIPISTIVQLYQRQLRIDVSREFIHATHLHLYRCPECDFGFFDPVVSGSEQLYEALQQYPWYYQEQKPEFETARRFINAADRVLEVGCGNGAFAAGLRPENYVGLEFSRHAASKARACGLIVDERSIEEYSSVAQGSFDIVCAFQVLEHVPNQGQFISSCLRACRPGGRLIFSTPSADAFVNAMQNCVINMPPHHTGWFSRQFWHNLPKYYPVRNPVVVDDPLDPIHHRLYAKTLLIASLARLLRNRPPELLDLSWRARISDRLAGIPARFLAYGLADVRLQPHGASVTAIYEKL